MQKLAEVSSPAQATMDLESSENTLEDSSTEYAQLQLRIFKLTLVVIAFSALATAIFVDSVSAISLLIGAFSGLIYLRLLARSIGNLGKTSKSVSKFQLLVPVILVLAVSKLPQLELLPSLVGFLLYKPSLILQFLIDP